MRSAGSHSSAVLNPETRLRALERLETEEFDLLVVGGGITGVGIALDAAARGLKVALIEQGDFAQGTSSRSSRLVHGGLRYLEQLDIGLIRQALRERHLLSTRVAPHLVRPIPFLFTIAHVWERAYVGAGILIYDRLAAKTRGVFPRHQHLSRSSTFAAAPALHPQAVRGSIRYWDAQVDDARLTLSVVRTAARLGAVVASRAYANNIDLGTRRAAVQVHCRESERQLEIRAKHLAVAAGVWNDTVLPSLGRQRNTIRPSKGVHILVPREHIRSSTALVTRTRISVLFVIPWDDVWLIGTTDTPWDGDVDSPTATRDDVAYLLDQVNRLLDHPISENDILGVYVGLRPLAAGPRNEATARLSRRHQISHAAPTVSFVGGGKLTTYRSTAAAVVDNIAARRGWTLPPSCTDEIPLIGASGFTALWNRRDLLAARWGVTREHAERLLRRYGTEAVYVLELCRDMPELGQPFGPEMGVVGAEIVHAVSREGALHLDDLLLRRTRIGVHRPDAAASVADVVAELAGDALNWNAHQRKKEVTTFREEARRTMAWRSGLSVA